MLGSVALSSDQCLAPWHCLATNAWLRDTALQLCNTFLRLNAWPHDTAMQLRNAVLRLNACFSETALRLNNTARLSVTLPCCFLTLSLFKERFYAQYNLNMYY